MLKKHELADPTSCLNKADSSEPVFVLRAKDPHAPQAVRHWATMAEGTHEADKIAEARAWATQAEAWRTARFDAQGNPHPEAAAPLVEVAKCAIYGCGNDAEPGRRFCSLHRA